MSNVVIIIALSMPLQQKRERIISVATNDHKMRKMNRIENDAMIPVQFPYEIAISACPYWLMASYQVQTTGQVTTKAVGQAMIFSISGHT